MTEKKQISTFWARTHGRTHTRYGACFIVPSLTSLNLLGGDNKWKVLKKTVNNNICYVPLILEVFGNVPSDKIDHNWDMTFKREIFPEIKEFCKQSIVWNDFEYDLWKYNQCIIKLISIVFNFCWIYFTWSTNMLVKKKFAKINGSGRRLQHTCIICRNERGLKKLRG